MSLPLATSPFADRYALPAEFAAANRLIALMLELIWARIRRTLLCLDSLAARLAQQPLAPCPPPAHERPVPIAPTAASRPAPPPARHARLRRPRRHAESARPTPRTREARPDPFRKPAPAQSPVIAPGPRVPGRQRRKPPD